MFTKFAISFPFCICDDGFTEPKDSLVEWLIIGNHWLIWLIQDQPKPQKDDVLWCYVMLFATKKHTRYLLDSNYIETHRTGSNGLLNMAPLSPTTLDVPLPKTTTKPLDDPKIHQDFNGGIFHVISASMRFWLWIPLPGWLNMVKHCLKLLNMIKYMWNSCLITEPG